MNTQSLSFRLVAWYAGLLTLVFLILSVLTFVLLHHYLEANLLDIQARRAGQIASTLLADGGPADKGALSRQVEALYSPETNDRFIRITRGDGQVVYVSGAPNDASFDPSTVPLLHVNSPPLVDSQPLQVEGKETFSRKVILDGSSALLVATVANGATANSRYLVEVGVTNARTERTLSQLLATAATGVPMAMFVAVIGGFVLVRRALKPVERMARTAEDITQHNLSQRLPVLKTGDELERLAISLNHMIERLEDSFQTSKQFVADASHELRTPLAVLRGELEGLAQDERLQPDTRETLGSMLEEVDRLAEIVEGLLALSRLDAGEANSEWVMFDLAELAATTADQMSLLAEDKNIGVVCHTSRSVNVEGHRARMKQVIVNLLDNAIKYTPAGGHIHMKVAEQEGSAVLEVADEGVGIPSEALPHVFKRFYRVDGSRSREQGGAGLGLSIVKSICTAHRARVEVESTPGMGSRFRITQPLVNKAPVPATP